MRYFFVLTLFFKMGISSLNKTQEWIEKQDSIETQAAAFDDLRALAKASDQSFAGTFLRVEPDRLLKILNAVQICENLSVYSTEILDGHYVALRYSIKDILNSLQLNIILNSMDIDGLDRAFYDKVYFPLMSTMNTMEIYAKDPTPENKQLFLAKFVSTISMNTLSHLLTAAPAILKNATEHSRYDRRVFNEHRSLLARCFFHFYVLHYLRKGIDGHNYLKQEETPNLSFEVYYGDERDNLDSSFQNNFNNLSVIFKKAFDKFNQDYFPGSVREDIIRPTLDAVISDNCGIAQYIFNQLKYRKSQWREFVVIVSDEVENDQLMYFGGKTKLVAEERYNGRTVLVFMASKNYKKKSEFLKLGGRNYTISLVPKSDWNIRYSSLEDARKGHKEYSQLAVFRGNTNPCIRPKYEDAYDFFDVNPPLNGKASHPFNFSVAVVF